MIDPKLALAIAIHEGAIALMVDHGEGAMDRNTAVQRSRQAMERIVDGEVREEHGGLDVTLSAIEAEFANGRFYHGETNDRKFMEGLAG